MTDPLEHPYISLDGIITRLEQENPNWIMPIGFRNPHSYRGFYDELAFEPARYIPISEVLAAAKSALNSTYEGYKGGYFTMKESTACWISYVGYTSDNKIGPLLLELLVESSFSRD